MKNELKLFVWTDFCSDWYCGLAFAVAENQKEAKKMIEKKHGYKIKNYNWGKMDTYPLTQKVCESVVGGS